MKTRWIGILLVAALAVTLGVASCIEEEDEDKGGGPALTWADIARAIDNQFKQISMGTGVASICAGNGSTGDHCKNQLQGVVTQATVIQLMRINMDMSYFFDFSSGPNAILFEHGFVPQTDSPCLEDVIAGGNGIPDYQEVCPGSLTCTDVGNHTFTLGYNLCPWSDGIINWIIDGDVNYRAYTTTENEVIVVASAGNFSLTDSATNIAAVMNGRAVRYLVLNPITGTPAMGTTGAQNGMIIISASMQVDRDGNGAWDRTYALNVAYDFEDGLALLSSNAAVWSSNPTALTNLTFYDRNHPWNIVGPGCAMNIVNLNPPARTFEIDSQSIYGPNGCLPDSTAPINY